LDNNSICKNYREVLERIGNAAISSGRNPDEVQLVVVTKGHPLEKLSRLTMLEFEPLEKIMSRKRSVKLIIFLIAVI